jgi:hypothetical protein
VQIGPANISGSERRQRVDVILHLLSNLLKISIMRIPQVILFAHNSRLLCLVVVRVSLALAGLLSWQAHALAESATAVANAPSLMPETLSNIKLGVTQAELLRGRPAISGSNLEEDDSGPATLLFESA